jgi:prepilin-type N-terminal cleavage/methylation domain-containing protein
MKPTGNAGTRSLPRWVIHAVTPIRRHADTQNYPADAGFSLIETLVVLAIIALAAGFITISILTAMKQQNSRMCLTNMLTIEAAKDEYARDHPGLATIPSVQDFAPYFRFGIPRCPDDHGTDYVNLLDLHNQVSCPVHPENAAKLNAGK